MSKYVPNSLLRYLIKMLIFIMVLYASSFTTELRPVGQSCIYHRAIAGWAVTDIPPSYCRSGIHAFTTALRPVGEFSTNQLGSHASCDMDNSLKENHYISKYNKFTYTETRVDSYISLINVDLLLCFSFALHTRYIIRTDVLLLWTLHSCLQE